MYWIIILKNGQDFYRKNKITTKISISYKGKYGCKPANASNSCYREIIFILWPHKSVLNICFVEVVVWCWSFSIDLPVVVIYDTKTYIHQSCYRLWHLMKKSFYLLIQWDSVVGGISFMYAMIILFEVYSCMFYVHTILSFRTFERNIHGWHFAWYLGIMAFHVTHIDPLAEPWQMWHVQSTSDPLCVSFVRPIIIHSWNVVPGKHF